MVILITGGLELPKLFYHKALKLTLEILTIMAKDAQLISDNLSVLRKFMIIPKKLVDPNYMKDVYIKEHLLYIMKVNLMMLRDMNDIGNYSKDTDTKISDEFPEFVKNTIVSI